MYSDESHGAIIGIVTGATVLIALILSITFYNTQALNHAHELNMRVMSQAITSKTDLSKVRCLLNPGQTTEASCSSLATVSAVLNDPRFEPRPTPPLTQVHPVQPEIQP